MTDVKNIIIVNDFAFINGGTAMVAINSAIGLSKFGYNVTFFSSVGPISSELTSAGINVICLNQNDILNDNSRVRAIMNGLWNGKAYRELKILLKNANNVDTIVHVHGWTKALSPSIWKAIKSENIKSVVTLHDFFLSCPNGGFYNYRRNMICSIKPCSFKCYSNNCDSRSYFHKIWRFNRQLIQNYFLQRISDLSAIYISNLNKEVLFPYLKNSIQNWYYLQNPIEKIDMPDIDIENNEYYIYIGRISKEKGVEMFCESITELGLKGIVVGDGYLKNKLENRFKNIIFTGWLNSKQKVLVINKAKALILSSLWYETFGLVVAEMKLAGIPCLVPDRCAASEQIINYKNGLIYRIGDKTSLKEKIIEFEKSNIYSFKSYLRDNCNLYTLNDHVNDLLKIYNKMLS